MHGLADELAKTAGVLRRVAGLVAKHPIVAMTAGGAALATGASAASAYRGGLRGGEKARYLEAGLDPATGEASAGQAAYNNYHQLLERKPSRREVWGLSRYYNEPGTAKPGILQGNVNYDTGGNR
jgi:hypothetical protein